MTSILAWSFTFCYPVSHFLQAETLEGACSILGKGLLSRGRVSLRSPTIALTFLWLLPSFLMAAPRAPNRVSASSLFLPQALGAALVNSVKEAMALCKLTPSQGVPKDSNRSGQHSCGR